MRLSCGLILPFLISLPLANAQEKNFNPDSQSSVPVEETPPASTSAPEAPVEPPKPSEPAHPSDPALNSEEKPEDSPPSPNAERTSPSAQTSPEVSPSTIAVASPPLSPIEEPPAPQSPVACEPVDCKPVACIEEGISSDILRPVRPIKTLAGGFRLGYRGMKKWIDAASQQVQTLLDHKEKIEKEIQGIEKDISDLKAKGDRESKRQAKRLKKKNKRNKRQIRRLQKDKKRLLKEIASETESKTNIYIEDLRDRLKTTRDAIRNSY